MRCNHRIIQGIKGRKKGEMKEREKIEKKRGGVTNIGGLHKIRVLGNIEHFQTTQ